MRASFLRKLYYTVKGCIIVHYSETEDKTPTFDRYDAKNDL